MSDWQVKKWGNNKWYISKLTPDGNNATYLNWYGEVQTSTTYFYSKSDAEKVLEEFMSKTDERLQQVEKDIELLKEERERLLEEQLEVYCIGDRFTHCGEDFIIIGNYESEICLVNLTCGYICHPKRHNGFVKVKDQRKITSEEFNELTELDLEKV